MFLSVIVASEFSIKQSLTDLPLSQFRILPFNIPHAIRAAELWRQLERDDGDNRAVVRDDLKLLAQADKESVPIMLTEDAIPCAVINCVLGNADVPPLWTF